MEHYKYILPSILGVTLLLCWGSRLSVGAPGLPGVGIVLKARTSPIAVAGSLAYTVEYYRPSASGGPVPSWAHWIGNDTSATENSNSTKGQFHLIPGTDSDDNPYDHETGNYQAPARLRNITKGSLYMLSLFNSTTVSPNGFITPVEFLPCAVYCMEYSTSKWPLMSVYTMDLDPSDSGGGVLWRAVDEGGGGSSSTVFLWNNIPPFGATNNSWHKNLTAQVQTWGNGSVVFRYQSVPSNLDLKTVFPRTGLFLSQGFSMPSEAPRWNGNRTQLSIEGIRFTPVIDDCTGLVSCEACAMKPACVWCTSATGVLLGSSPAVQPMCLRIRLASEYCLPQDQYKSQCATAEDINYIYAIQSEGWAKGAAGPSTGTTTQDLQLPEGLTEIRPSTSVKFEFKLPIVGREQEGTGHWAEGNVTFEVGRKGWLAVWPFLSRPSDSLALGCMGPLFENEFNDDKLYPTVSTTDLPQRNQSRESWCEGLLVDPVLGFCPPDKVFHFSASSSWVEANRNKLSCTMLLRQGTGEIFFVYPRDTMFLRPYTASVAGGILPYWHRDPPFYPYRVELPWPIISTPDRNTIWALRPVPLCPVCAYGGYCDNRTRKCVCAHGFTGMRCESCQSGKYLRQFAGEDFLRCIDCPLECYNGGTCDTGTDGTCRCPVGYDGLQCEIQCPFVFEQSSCSALNCNFSYGSCQCGKCQCIKGARGGHCEVPPEQGDDLSFLSSPAAKIVVASLFVLSLGMVLFTRRKVIRRVGGSALKRCRCWIHGSGGQQQQQELSAVGTAGGQPNTVLGSPLLQTVPTTTAVYVEVFPLHPGHNGVSTKSSPGTGESPPCRKKKRGIGGAKRGKKRRAERRNDSSSSDESVCLDNVSMGSLQEEDLL